MAVENKYLHSKIYKIVDNNYTKMYIGSTTQSLAERMAGHRRHYKHKKSTTSSLIFDEFGVDNCKIELIENVACQSKDELRQREGFYIKNNECVNRVIPTRTQKEWRDANMEKIKEYRKNYMPTYKIEHLDEFKERAKKYRQEHPDKVREQLQNWRKANKEKIAEKRKEMMTCECGSTLQKVEYTRHIKTVRHTNYINDKLELCETTN